MFGLEDKQDKPLQPCLKESILSLQSIHLQDAKVLQTRLFTLAQIYVKCQQVAISRVILEKQSVDHLGLHLMNGITSHQDRMFLQS